MEDAKRPPPPPPPPKSLIKLLQSDKGVLKYFTLLQANLEADKAKWKDRAIRFEKECEELKKKITEQASSVAKIVMATKEPKELPNNSRDRPSEQSSNSKNGEDAPSGEPIDDNVLGDIFNNLSSDDDDDSSEDFGFNTKAAPQKKPSLGLLESSDEESEADLGVTKDEIQRDEGDHSESSSNSDEKSSVNFDFGTNFDDDQRKPAAVGPAPTHCHHPFRDVHYDRLHEAYNHLKRLGVALVNDDESRRPDEDVVEDLLAALRAVSRVQLVSRTKGCTEPFIGMIPACDCKGHPAYEAKLCAFKALCIMDLFCGEMDPMEWENLTVAPNDDESKLIQVGMRNRQSLAKNLMQSLSGEVADAWPVADRAARKVSTATHFDPTETNIQIMDNRVDTEAEFGAKSQARLSTIVERCILVQLLAHYYDHRNRPIDRVLLLCRYVLATAPSPAVEDYPKYPPVLSMCIIEALVTQRSELGSSTGSSFTDAFEEHNETLRAVALAIHLAMYIWEKRCRSHDDRVTDIARVQVASYERVLQLDLPWFGQGVASLEDVKTRCKAFGHSLESGVGVSILAIIDETSAHLLEEATKTDPPPAFFDTALAQCITSRNLTIRRLDWYRDCIGTTTACVDEFKEQSKFLCRMDGASTIDNPELYWNYISATAKCCVHLSDGDRAAKLARFVLESSVTIQSSDSSYEALLSLARLSQIPVVRSINLLRRADRRNVFQAQAKVEKLLMVDAVVDFDAQEGDPCYYWGCRAYDGRSETVDKRSDEYVATHWRPSDLKAFDEDAISNKGLVKISSSERACALSHISSWEGVRRSLELSLPFEVRNRSLNNPRHLLRLFRISGFASGRALLAENESMAPSAVCVILEDDAILVDRFVDRLDALLHELPRDFHFCSLGYSRPKTAPIVPYSSQLGIPTCIWYLTGYVLSLEGSKYLQHKLPVRGPVDSWIGLRMCANWENEYGQAIGVGMQTKATGGVPSRKELGQILKFRSFCALVPLCAQRVQVSSAGARRSWRQRDTDIEYSGA